MDWNGGIDHGMNYGIFVCSRRHHFTVFQHLLSLSTLSDLRRASFIAVKATSYVQNVSDEVY